jgi:hypothetical protein
MADFDLSFDDMFEESAPAVTPAGRASKGRGETPRGGTGAVLKRLRDSNEARGEGVQSDDEEYYEEGDEDDGTCFPSSLPIGSQPVWCVCLQILSTASFRIRRRWSVLLSIVQD